MVTRVVELSNLTAPPTLMEMAFAAIKNSIINGSLEAGSVYSEKMIADKLGISKTPVREALINLQLKGFVTILPKRGFQVRLLTAKDIRDIYEFRIALERAVVEKVTANLTDDQLHDLDGIFSTNRNHSDIHSYMENNMKFHRYLARLTDNRKIIEALEEIWDLCFWVGFNALTLGGDIEEAHDEHRILLSNLKKRDVAEAEAAIIRHLESSLEKILAATPA